MSDLESAIERMSPSEESSSDPIINRKHFYIVATLYVLSALFVFASYRVMSSVPFWEEVMVALFLGLPLSSLALFLLLLFREMYLVFVIFLRLMKKLREENNI
nr:putative membrane protein [Cedratvirus lena]